MNRHTKVAFKKFAREVEFRLEDGEDTYEDRSFSADPNALIGEIRQELADVAGWAFILDRRLANIQAAAAALRARIGGAKGEARGFASKSSDT